MKTSYDVIIVGGGPGGLSSALTLARGGRSVLVFDNFKPRNAPAEHMQNFPSQDGTNPMEYRKMVEKEIEGYGVVIERAKVEALKKIERSFEVNGTYTARKIILAHGVRDILPGFSGINELFGKSIFLCPYCHGYEHRNGAIGLMANSTVAKHMIPILKGLTNDLMWFTDGEMIEDKPLGVTIHESKVVGFKRQGEKLEGVQLANGETVARSFLFAKFPQQLTTDLGIKLGCALNEMGYYQVNENYKTSVDGVYAVGDAVLMRQSVLLSTASGQIAGATLNYEILEEEFNNS